MFTGEVLQGTGFRTIASLAPDYSYLDPVVENMVRQDPDQRPVISEVKKQLLARQEQFVSLQKIDQLTREVVPEQTIDDPLVRNPITLKAVDYQAGELFFTSAKIPILSGSTRFSNRATLALSSEKDPEPLAL